MSTPNPVPAAGGPINPFPLEERGQQEQQTINPWNGPVQPHWYSGLGFNEDNLYMGPLGDALRGAGEGAAKGEELLGGLWHTGTSLAARSMGIGDVYQAKGEDIGQEIQADARERVKALTPDPTTTGAAASIIHGLSSGLTRYAAGSLLAGPAGAAAVLGGSEATNRYTELQEQGVTPGAATASAAVEGVAAGAGALLPAGIGSSLIGKILTGAAGNVGFGIASRYADHKVLELAGYPAMAQQQDIWDKTAMATDLILGGAFGAIAHVHGEPAAAPEDAKAQIQTLEERLGRNAPGVEDAALTANLAARDRASAPGVAVDPVSANAHQAALESATQSLLEGKPVQVDGTGVQNATFAARPPEERPAVRDLFVNALKEGGYLDEKANLDRLEQALGARLRGEGPPAELGASHIAPPLPARETPEQERAANQPYRPAETEIAAAGAKFSDDNADRVALVARAMEANPDRVNALAAEHAGDPNAFIEASRQVIFDEYAATAQRGEGGGGAPAGDANLGGQRGDQRAGAANEPHPGAEALTATGGAESRGAGAAVARPGEPRAAAGTAGATHVDPLADPARQAVAEKPAMQIPGDDGKPVSAADELSRADEAAAQGERDIPKAVMAAINCFQRRGGG